MYVIAAIFATFSMPDAVFSDDPAPVGGPSGKTFTYNSSFSDEFGGSAVDTDKWSTTISYYPGRWPSYHVSDSSQVSGGYLHQTLDLGGLPDPIPEDPINGPYIYSTGGIISKNFTSFGYYEASIRTSSVAADQAFWLNTSFGEGNGKKREIDIVEQPGSWNPNMAHFNAHAFDRDENGIITGDSYPGYYISPTDLTEDFHTYGLHWSPEEITWYFDGVERFQIANTDFDIPMRILLTLETNIEWLGAPELADLPATMSVDYVRVWSVSEVPEPSTLALWSLFGVAGGVVAWRKRKG